MTTPVGKNWPEIQTIDGNVVATGVVSVQNPTVGGMPPIKVPLEVTIMNASQVVTPLVPNFPSTNGFTCDVPADGSGLEATLFSSGGELPPYRFRDPRGDGDVREFCGGFLPYMRLYWRNPLNYALVLEVINTLCLDGDVLADAGGTYPMPLGQQTGYIEIGGIHAPSYAVGLITHVISFKLSCPGGHAEAKYDVGLILCSHYDVIGDAPI